MPSPGSTLKGTVAPEPKLPKVDDGLTLDGASTALRRGKTPPVDTFSGRTSFEDWYHALKCAAKWNAWTNEETLLQLSGHLRGMVTSVT